ncbi:aminotransferase class V [Clostridium sp. CAG:571]|nr:aminotransferase class V [Clostridium sp. CAG:571]
MNEEYIYLDYASNTPVDKDVLNTFNEITLKYFANPNSTHILGKVTNKKIQETTENIIKELSKKANLDENMEIIYTSGSSESNNLAIKGIAKSYKENGKHIISTFLEHSSVSSPLTYLREQGYEIDIVNITNEGKVDLEHLKSLIRKDTILVSICYIDSEVGIVQPIEEIAKIVKEYPNCFFHVDCTQAVGKINIDLNNIDLISFAPHKFYGLNGFGALIKNKEIVLEPLINGGASTTIYRSGTPVIGQICALEKALEISFNNLEERKKYVKNINKKLRENLSKYKDVKINTISDENPFILNISVNGVKATEFKNKLEEYGVCISIKSACTITITPSRIVMAMTHDRKRALDSFRISLSHLVKESEINKFLEIFDKCYKYFKEV